MLISIALRFGRGIGWWMGNKTDFRLLLWRANLWAIDVYVDQNHGAGAFVKWRARNTRVNHLPCHCRDKCGPQKDNPCNVLAKVPIY